MGNRARDPYNLRAFNWSGFLPAFAQTWIQTIPDNFHSQNPLGHVAVGRETVTLSRRSLGKSHPYTTMKSFGHLKGTPRTASVC